MFRSSLSIKRVCLHFSPCYGEDISVMERTFLLGKGYFCYGEDISVVERTYLLWRGHFCCGEDISVEERTFLLQ